MTTLMNGVLVRALGNPGSVCGSIIDFIASGSLISVPCVLTYKTWVMPVTFLFLQSIVRINEPKHRACFVAHTPRVFCTVKLINTQGVGMRQ